MRRPAHVYGRQRMVLADSLSSLATGCLGGEARRGRYPRLGCGAWRILPQLHWRVWRAVAAIGTATTNDGGYRILRPRLRRLLLFPPLRGKPRSARRVHFQE